MVTTSSIQGASESANNWKSIEDLTKETHHGYVWVRFKPDPDIDLPAYTAIGRIAVKRCNYIESEGYDQTGRASHYMILKPPSPPK